MNEYYKRTFYPTMESIKTHKVPAWYHAGKVGIFIHWGLYSVPAFAPPACELGEIEPDIRWFGNNPYAEWYMNSIRIGHGASYDYHIEKYGKDYEYNNFVNEFKAENYDPDAWAALFKEAGARYVIPVTKHHDGFCLWDSKYTDFSSVKQGPKRDLIEELAQAVHKHDMRLGLYYSGLLDWQFALTPITDNYDLNNPPNITSAYADYAYNQCIELIDKYRPSVLWNDIGWPHKGLVDLPMLFSYYYNHVEDGVVNDRWNGVWHDFTTKEYKHGSMDLANKWEMCRGLGLSFGYNKVEDESHIISKKALLELLVKTVSHNGNLLINVGPKADGSIPEIQAQRLREMGAWLKDNGEAIYDTFIWERQLDRLPNDLTVYYTQNAEKVYAMLVGLGQDNQKGEIIIPDHTAKYKQVRALNYSEDAISVKQIKHDVIVKINKAIKNPDILTFEFVK